MTRFSCAESERNWCDDVPEVGLRRLHPGDAHDLVGVDQVLHHHHGVVPLLDRLPVEVRGELRKRLRVVVRGDRDVLLRGAELVADLAVECIREARHGVILDDAGGR